jgi:hypothetical protein
MCPLCSKYLPKPKYEDQILKCCVVQYVVERASDGSLYWTEYGLSNE